MAGLAAILLIVALAAAISVDVVRAGFGIKSDEATYVAMAMSLAYDRDLRYERRDLERFWGIYHTGPEGIFLKRGKQLRMRWRRSPPYLQVSRVPDQRTDRLYYGKAFIYPLAAAPFVRLSGLNGFLVLHVLLLFGVGVAGYRFLSAGSRAAPALLFTLAFLGASALPAYMVFLTPEVFNFSLVFFACFLWLYKEVAPADGARFLRGSGTDLGAAILLGVATYSKPYPLLILPLVALHWWRRRLGRGLVVGVVFAATTAGMFGANFLITGDFNYQGGDRKTFYSGRESVSGFPLESPAVTWDNRGLPMATDDSDAANVLERSELVNRLALNMKYFLIGRHFGFVPYYFPGAVAAVLWVFSKERFRIWRVLTFAAVVGSEVVVLMFLPYTWSGGGGPPGNRYFLSLYPAMFFLTPPLTSLASPILAWIGGALFTAKMLVNPFIAAKYPFETTERGAARRLPVELTMGNDLPVVLDTSRPRAHLPYGYNPTILLYFLDAHAYTPDPEGIWISGGGRADILVRSENPLDHLVVTAMSPIRTLFTISVGGAPLTVQIEPRKTAVFNLPTTGVRGLKSYAYLLWARSSEGFVPRLLDPRSQDPRNLGVLIRLTPVEAVRSR